MTSPTKGHFFKLGKPNQPTRHKNKNSNLAKMRQQRNIFQTNEQEKTPEELSEMERGNLPEKEFKDLRRRMNA